MQRTARFTRFEPVTVRAAARVAHLARLGRLSSLEERHLLHELAATARHARRVHAKALARLARRRAALGNTGVAASRDGRGLAHKLLVPSQR
jgi:hypothetical protein